MTEPEKSADTRHPIDSDNSNKNDTKHVSQEDVNVAAKAEESQEESKKAGTGDYFRIFRYTDRLDRILYAIGIIGAIIVGATLPLMTLIFGSSTTSFNNYAVGNGGAQDFQHRINHLVLYFVYLFIGRFVIGYISTLSICIAAARTTNSVRKAFLESLLRQEIAHFDKAGNGSPATQVTTNGNRINQGIAEKLYTFVMGISLFFASYIVALAVHWKLALIVIGIVPANILIIGGAVRLDAPIEARIIKLYSQAATIAQDAIGSIKTIHAFGAQSKIVETYNEYLESAHKEGNKKSLIYGTIYCSQNFLVMAATALAFWEGFRLFQSGDIPNVGTVFTVVLSITLGASSVIFILPQIQSLTNASSAAAELFAIIDKPSEMDPLSTEGKRPEASDVEGDIVVKDLCFAYPARPGAPVLQSLNLSIPARKTTAIVGPSGCGKSTLVGLLERWYQPTSGQILFDGCDITEMNTNWLRSNIRLVQQEPTLFYGTVFDNVAKGLVGDQLNLSDEAKMKLIQEACIATDAHDFIERLPEGYHTQLGERANMLSGGQRQRIAIARSIISDPKVLLFDEATSALDPRAERVVQDALDRVSTNKTTIIIAHKLATVMAADSIAVMANGKIVEQGSHTHLIEQDGLYAAMVRAQDLGSEEGTNDQDDTERPGLSEKSNERRISTISIERVQSGVKSETPISKTDNLTAGTMGYSLIKCIFIMLKEHPDVYWLYASMFGVYLVCGCTFPAQALLFSHLIEVFTLTGPEAKKQADFYALMFFIVALVNLVGYFIIGVVSNTIGQTLTHRYRREMIERILNFDQDFFDQNTSGALTSKLSSVPSAVQELMSSNLGLIVLVLVNILATSILAIVFGWKLGLIMVFAGLTVIVAGGYIRIRLDQKLEASTEEQFASSASLASEAVTSIRTVSLLTLEPSVMHEYKETLDAIVNKVVRNLVVTLIPYAFSQSAEFLVMAFGFWYGSQLISKGEYTTSQFFVIFIAVVFGGQGAAQFFGYTTSITKAKGSSNYILWLRTIKSDIRETEQNKNHGPPGDEVSIDMQRVEFAYKQRSARVLRGISLSISKGTYCAFVGPSGCGKSTIVSLLERFYDPTSGNITLNDEDISLMSPILYRRVMSLVQQEPPLYLGSVRDNIAIGLDYEPTEEEIQEACRQANAFDFVTSLPEGLNTPCGSKGLQFSGGQRQRIAVARALVRKPRLLLLDEATSALDTQSERIVQKALDDAASNRTTVAVAHRLSTIRHADMIFVIEDGRIAERGTHEELQRLKGRYYAMCLAQSLDQA